VESGLVGFEPSAMGEAAPVLVVSRYRVSSDRPAWLAQMRVALGVLGESAGFLRGQIAQATDDANLMVVCTSWESVGAYRRALSRYEVKLQVIPLLSTAIDEPSAFESVVVLDETGEQLFASGLAADHGDVGLGSAAAASVASITGGERS
jgi:hypothetical protein